jgi:hypothetical protein
MEDVLDLYQQPYDPNAPLICMDETSKQLVGETRVPLALAPGTPARHDYEYERLGTANLFLFTEPLKNRRWVSVTQQRTALDWAHQIRALLEVRYPKARVLRLVMDNLNTHTKASLYKAFPPQEARQFAQRLEIHYTPKHGSWLNIAEIELRILSVQCLDRRIAEKETLIREVAAWEQRRNNSEAKVDWQFSVDNARIKLKRLYPQFLP